MRVLSRQRPGEPADRRKRYRAAVADSVRRVMGPGATVSEERAAAGVLPLPVGHPFALATLACAANTFLQPEG